MVENPDKGFINMTLMRCSEGDALAYVLKKEGESRSFPDGESFLDGASDYADIVIHMGTTFEADESKIAIQSVYQVELIVDNKDSYPKPKAQDWQQMSSEQRRTPLPFRARFFSNIRYFSRFIHAVTSIRNCSNNILV